MRIGIDFDNTIVCYDQVFHQVALEQGMIPADLPLSKSAVRDYLRAAGREDDWTKMQGEVYGRRMSDAQPFPGVLDALSSLLREITSVFIVSHKTRHPYRGPKYDLHRAAQDWLDQHGVFDAQGIGLPRENAFFELTLADKLRRIASLKCTHFVDDLPELLAEPEFPDNTFPLLFDPNEIHRDAPFERLASWSGLNSVFLAT